MFAAAAMTLELLQVLASNPHTAPFFARVTPGEIVKDAAGVARARMVRDVMDAAAARYQVKAFLLQLSKVSLLRRFARTIATGVLVWWHGARDLGRRGANCTSSEAPVEN